ALSALHAGRAENGDVIRLRAARRETHLVRIGAKTTSDALPRLVQRRTGLSSPTVGARRVPEPRPKEGQHRFENLRQDRGGGSVVEVDRLRHAPEYSNRPVSEGVRSPVLG